VPMRATGAGSRDACDSQLTTLQLDSGITSLRQNEQARTQRRAIRKDLILHVPLLQRFSEIERLNCPRRSRRTYRDNGGRRSHSTECKCWSCSACAIVNALIVRVLIEAGLLSAARRRLPCLLVTFTSARSGTSSSDYERCFRRMRAATPDLRTSLSQSAMALGLHKSGAHHVHAAFIGLAVSEAMLKRAASDAGLGKTHVEPIGPASHDARDVARYLARELPAVASRPTGGRNQPASLSRGWPAGGISEGRTLVFEALREQRERSVRI
jgi:hypothetical protein